MGIKYNRGPGHDLFLPGTADEHGKIYEDVAQRAWFIIGFLAGYDVLAMPDPTVDKPIATEHIFGVVCELVAMLARLDQ